MMNASNSDQRRAASSNLCESECSSTSSSGWKDSLWTDDSVTSYGEDSEDTPDGFDESQWYTTLILHTTSAVWNECTYKWVSIKTYCIWN